MDLDVIIPVKDRPTVEQCVATLLKESDRTPNFKLRQILLCDGGSTNADCCAQLTKVSQQSQVNILQCPHKGFNKGWLLNQGLLAATELLILISDVDIVWTTKTLIELSQAAAQNPYTFYHIQSVQESQFQNIAVQRSRYAYCITQSLTEKRVEIYADMTQAQVRPGYGLLCAHRELLEQVGGYRHDFAGWGWEDQDLLMRSQLLGYAIRALGTVTHLSHPDTHRNQFSQQCPQQSRDRNIRRCLDGLAQGKLWGDLRATSTAERTYAGKISIHYPPQLHHAAYPDHPLPRSSCSSNESA
ncbi:MAG: glycosyltransferase family 2 protein [Spirulina sp. SIO3F2]|nr:glycosyltransferase family 2 protein [Spirulina sp. SIO3F2]